MAEIIDKRFPRIVTTDSQNNTDLKTGGTGTIEITKNGTFDVNDYAEASVEVPASEVVSGTLPITSNGEVDVTEYASVNVNVPSPTPITQKEPITITAKVVAYGEGSIFGLDENGYAKLWIVRSNQTITAYVPRTTGQIACGLAVSAFNTAVLEISGSSDIGISRTSAASYACVYIKAPGGNKTLNVTFNNN